MYVLYVASKNSGKVRAGEFESIRQAVQCARNCYGKGTICEILCNTRCEVVKTWTLRK